MRSCHAILSIFLSLVLCISQEVHAQDAASTEGEEIVIREVPDSVTRKMSREKDFLYANDMRYWQEKESDETSLAFLVKLEQILNSNLTRWILYGLLSIAALFVLYQVIILNKFQLFSRDPARKQVGNDLIPAAAENLETMLQQAVKEGDYRLAVRTSYLITLKSLHDARELELQARATNNDYLLQMSKSSRYPDFVRLTGLYEYVWYGEFQPDVSQFERIRDYFTRFNRKS